VGNIQLSVDELMADDIRQDQDGGVGLLVFRVGEVGRNFTGCSDDWILMR